MSRITAIIQARQTSSRLPGKSLADVWGKPLIERVHDRVKAADLEQIVYAIPDTAANDTLAYCIQERGWNIYRGPEDDVLGRYVGAARAFDADPIVRLTADCPLLDPGVVNGVVNLFRTGEYEYVSNTLERTFPDGLDVECVSRAALIAADESTQDPFEREHPMEFITRHPDRFRLGNLRFEHDLSRLRWTVDYESDLELVREIYLAFKSRAFFTTADILWLMERRPELVEVNAEHVS